MVTGDMFSLSLVEGEAGGWPEYNQGEWKDVRGQRE